MDFTIFHAGQAEWIKWIRMDWNGSRSDPKMDQSIQIRIKKDYE